MGERIVDLEGFEEAVCDFVAGSFQFSTEGMVDLVLSVGRHLFVDDMPETEGLVKTSSGFDPKKEPTISIYNAGGPSVQSTVSSNSKCEWNLRLVLRFGVVFETAKALLEQLVKWIEKNLRGRRVGRHKVKGVFIVNRPSPFQRAGDSQAYCSATLRILAVPIP